MVVMRMCHNYSQYNFLNQVEKSKHKYPNQIHYVPIQTHSLDHLIATTPVVEYGSSSIENQEQEAHPYGHVETMESCYEEEQVGKCDRSILVFDKIGSVNGSFDPLIVYQFCDYSSFFCTVNKVRPFPCLTAKEGNPAQ